MWYGWRIGKNGKGPSSKRDDAKKDNPSNQALDISHETPYRKEKITLGNLKYGQKDADEEQQRQNIG
ncbi:hypothetical protein WUBG_02243 [Wuchereria bancrofti]|nr:hypothetical protein WUBG_02243 [Wuchereria bancrofti]